MLTSMPAYGGERHDVAPYLDERGWQTTRHRSGQLLADAGLPVRNHSQSENYYCTAQLGALVVSQVALPEANVVPGVVFVAGLEKMSDAGEPVPLVQPDARIVGQRDHRDGAMESPLAQAVE